MKTIRAIITLAALSGASLVLAVPVQFSTNGHWYERFDAKINWQDAELAAESLGGYLATVTSMEENQFLTVNKYLGDTPNYTDVLNPDHAPFADLLQYHWLGGLKETDRRSAGCKLTNFHPPTRSVQRTAMDPSRRSGQYNG